jgi:L-ribulose-5-phosphate 4-epimerase
MRMLEQLKEQVCRANVELQQQGLITLTWGNVSGIDRDWGLVAIKPSGVSYADLTPERIVLVDMNGRVKSGALKPSSDTATHIRLYKAFPEIGGVAHTHSLYATIFAQAEVPIRCMGTTHADHFFGEVPVTRRLTAEEVAGDYEASTGDVIVERFAGINPVSMPAVLVAGHAPFTWGRTAMDAVHNSIALESVAQMALSTLRLNPDAELPDYVLQKHYQRKHGPNAYYGQKK